MKILRHSYLLILLLSCENLFHEQTFEYITLENYDDKVDMLNGMYDLLVDVHNSDYFLLFCRSDDIQFQKIEIVEYDRITGKRDPTKSYSNYMTNSKFNVIGQTYTRLYKAIIGANNIILKTDENNYPVLMGEVYLLRAYCYLKLARFFGTPPIVNDIDVNYGLPKPSYKEVYEFIEGDLLKAIDLLPETPQDTRIPGESPHQGTAMSLLAEVYLSMAGYPANITSKYAEAAKLAGEIIKNRQKYGYGLLDDFADLWDSGNKYHSEDVFSLHFNYNDNAKLNGFDLVDLSSVDTIKNKYGFFYSNWDYIPEFNFFKRFPHNYRKYTTMTVGRYFDDLLILPDTSYFVKKFVIFDPEQYPYTYLSHVRILKWVDIEGVYRMLATHPDEFEINGSTIEIYGNYKPTTNLYFLRYAHTLLTYAEAKARIGELDQDALEALNMVRRRSYNVDIYSPSEYDIDSDISPDKFIDTVVAERSYEFFMEPDGRWFDIIRLDLKDKIPSLLFEGSEPSESIEDKFTEDWYFYKIPEEDKWLNENL